MVWKLLRKHISVPQFVGFVFANLIGMAIVLLGFQFYRDVVPMLTAEDGFLKSDFVVLSKKVGTAQAISQRSLSFSPAEIENLAAQPFVDKVGQFMAAEFKVDASMRVDGKFRRTTGRSAKIQPLCPSSFHEAISPCITSGLHRTVRCPR